MKRRLSTFALVVIFLVGLGLLLYPTVSDYWNSFHSSRIITAYEEAVSTIDADEYAEYYQAAVDYNASILKRSNPFKQTKAQEELYPDLLNIAGNGVIGYIEIESIGVDLPIYHGTDSSVLQTAIGHLEWTSLPVGGESTHCVLSGHRGLPSARLFTDIDRLVVGDTFVIKVLDETLTYEVDQILTVLPEDTSALQVVEGEDYCTLVTCTPYGINTHRLLVRGHRVENQEVRKVIHVSADAVQIETFVVAAVAAVPFLILLLLVIFVLDKRNKKDEGSDSL